MKVDKVFKLLLLEDNQDDAYLVLRALKRQGFLFESERVDSRNEFIESLDRFQPDAILSDHGLPGFSSREALELCQKRNAATAFIVVSGVDRARQDFDYLAVAADDYILKSDLSGLSSVILAALEKRNRHIK